MSLPKFAATRSFHVELKNRINHYFEATGKSTTGSTGLLSKAAILLLGFVVLYVHLVFFTPAPMWALLEAVVLGGTIAAIGFNVMHDGAHGSFSQHKWLNNVAAFTLNVLGGSSYMWNAKHNLVHHMYTNIDGADDDIDIQPWMRMSLEQKRHKLHRFQHLYFWFLYCLLYISWIFVMDYQKYFKRKIGTIAIKKMEVSDHLVFWGFKVLNLALYIGLPIYTLGFVNWLIGFAVVTSFAGLVLSLVFQLAHTVEHTAFPVPHATTNKLEDEWAIHQIKTTANFATESRVISWLVGGLNFQVEHHLFPKISHVHYPALSKIIKQACAEFNVTYNEFPRMRQAVLSHVLFLRQMGRAA
ncbi:acyl-CoA desaturase [Hymenobacter busanensis]|uniref:Acyl-CoA desaturase n=1 Tax=Hymenobacter busanensis TaxID=2607656 RepID=A0A7L5A0N8_9BACT|nr:acyl-CoA desaturase [Hymenobacter busanensis]KAA9338232.1 acyl-CoA desaturase [Hymenobacter busanensis]QHJ09344.1 acyl-CoA desaturase [Hymenobacter busanensis]